MISEKMVTLGTKKSVIREIFEYSKKRAAEIGTENVKPSRFSMVVNVIFPVC